MRERLPNQPNNDRRRLLQGIAVTGASALFPGVASAAAGYEKSPLRGEDTDFFKSIISNPARLQEFRSRGTWQEMRSMIRVLARLDTSQVDSREKKLHAGAMQLFNAKGAFIGQGTRLRVKMQSESGADTIKYVVVTAAHVAEAGARVPGSGQWKMHEKGYDIALCEVVEKNQIALSSSLGAIDFDLRAPQKESMGQIATVQGMDNDSGKFALKSHASHISPTLSPHLLYNALQVSPETSTGTKSPYSGEEVRLAVVPREELRMDARGHVPKQGLSGAAVMCGGRFAGVVSSSIQQSFGKESYALDLFIDSSHVQQLISQVVERKPRLAQSR